MKPHQESEIRSALDGLAGGQYSSRDKVLAYAHGFEALISDCMAELAKEQAILDRGDTGATDQSAGVELRIQAAHLARRNHEIALISRMNTLLQACSGEAEAYAIIDDTVARLFPGDPDAASMPGHPRSPQQAAVWGAAPQSAAPGVPARQAPESGSAQPGA